MATRAISKPGLRASLSLALGAGSLFMPGCAKDAAPKETAVPVQIVRVEKKSLDHSVSADAVLYPLAQAAIVPKISAPIKKFFVKRGSAVHEGELLATLESRDLAAAAMDNRGSYDQAQAAYKTTTAAGLPEEMEKAKLEVSGTKQALDAQEQIYNSRKSLFEQGALPRKELDQSLVDFTQAKNQYALAQQHFEALQKVGHTEALKGAAGQLESAKGKYLGAEAQLSYSEIRSPISGVVTERALYPGEMAAAGTPLITVMDITRVVARAHIAQREAQSLKTGDTASLIVPGEEEPVEGRVTLISPALDPGSTTVEVWVQAKNTGRLRPGTSVRVEIVAQTIKDALVIPAEALLTGDDGATTVMAVSPDGHAQQRAVKTGIRESDEVQILEGVNAGETVVGAGAYGLPDKAKVEQAPAEKSDNADDKSGKPAAATPAGKDSDDK